MDCASGHLGYTLKSVNHKIDLVNLCTDFLHQSCRSKSLSFVQLENVPVIYFFFLFLPIQPLLLCSWFPFRPQLSLSCTSPNRNVFEQMTRERDCNRPPYLVLWMPTASFSSFYSKNLFFFKDKTESNFRPFSISPDLLTPLRRCSLKTICFIKQEQTKIHIYMVIHIFCRISKTYFCRNENSGFSAPSAVSNAITAHNTSFRENPKFVVISRKSESWKEPWKNVP